MKRSAKFLVFFLLIILSFSVDPLFGKGIQKSSIASLEEKADSLFQLENLEEATSLYLKIIDNQIAEKGHAEYELLYKTGHTLVMHGKENDAFTYLKSALEGAFKAGDSLMVIRCSSSLGRVYEYTGKPDSAFHLYKKFLKYWEAGTDSSKICSGYQNMATLLRVMGRYDEARKYINAGLHLVPGIKDLKVLANLYNETAYLFELANQLDSAKIFYLKLIETSGKFNYLKGVSAGHSNLASVLTKENNFKEALKYYRLGLEIDLQLEYDYFITCSYRGIADCYFGMKDYQKAIEYIHLSDKHCNPDWLNENLINEEKKYNYYKAAGNYLQALLAHEKFKEMEDSLLSSENQKNISEILTKYETEKKENQINLLDNINRLNIQKIKSRNLLLAGSFLLLVSVLLLAFNVIQAKNRRISKMEIELHAFVSKLNTEEQDPEEKHNKELVRYSKLGLTQRESEILDLMQKGLTNKQIGDKLFVSENTIKFHLKNIYVKLDVKNRIQATQIRISD